MLVGVYYVSSVPNCKYRHTHTFADRSFTSHHAAGVDVGDVDGQIPAAAVHSSRYGHAQRFARLFNQRHRLLVTPRLLARILAKKSYKSHVSVLSYDTNMTNLYKSIHF